MGAAAGSSNIEGDKEGGEEKKVEEDVVYSTEIILQIIAAAASHRSHLTALAGLGSIRRFKSQQWLRHIYTALPSPYIPPKHL